MASRGFNWDKKISLKEIAQYYEERLRELDAKHSSLESEYESLKVENSELRSNFDEVRSLQLELKRELATLKKERLDEFTENMAAALREQLIITDNLRRSLVFPSFLQNSSLLRAVRDGKIPERTEIHREEKVRSTVSRICEMKGVGDVYIHDLERLRLLVWNSKMYLSESEILALVMTLRDYAEIYILKHEPQDVVSYCRLIGFDVTYSSADSSYKVSAADFVFYSRNVFGSRYEMGRQRVENGYVFVDYRTLGKLVREFFRESLKAAFESVDRKKAFSLRKED